MRRFVYIASVLLGCLLFAAGGGTDAAAADAVSFSGTDVPGAALTVDRAADAERLCRSAYNSDLNLPRVCGEISASWASPAQARAAASAAARAALRRLTALHDANARGETSSDKPFDPSAGPHAVDYYVYRLRRLII